MLSLALGSARAVAISRMLIATGALLTCFEGASFVSHLQNGRIRVPVATWIPSPDSLPLMLWTTVLAGACVFLMLGVSSSLCAAVIALGNVLLLLVDQQTYSSHRLLLVLLCLWLTVARPDRAWSVQNRLRPPADPAGRTHLLVPWWPQLLIIATVSSCYLFAGLSKVNPEFLTGDLIGSMSPSWVPAQVIAWLTPPTEIAVALGIWWRPTRRLAMLLGVALHLSIVVLLNSPLVFGAFALLCLSAYPLIWTWPDRDQREAAATQRSSAA